MEWFAFPLLALTPGVFWLWFFVRKDRYRPEPKRLLALTFFLGMVSTIPAGIAEALFPIVNPTVSVTANFGSMATVMLLVVGPAEETAKFLAVRLKAYRSLYFDEPVDGLVYAAAASLGFATLENLFYIIEFGPAVMIGRAPLSTVAHVVFGSFWGWALGAQLRRRDSSGFWKILAGVLAAAVFHGLFNVAVFTFWPAAVVMVALGGWWTARRFDWGQRISPFRYMRNYPKIECAGCGQRISVISRFCRFCGAPAGQDHAALLCSHCGNRSRTDADYCSKCGDRLLRR